MNAIVPLGRVAKETFLSPLLPFAASVKKARACFIVNGALLAYSCFTLASAPFRF